MRNSAPSPNGFRINSLLKPHRKLLVVGFLGVLGEGVANLLEPWPLKIVLDNVLRSKPANGWLNAWILSSFGNDKLGVLKFAATGGNLKLLVQPGDGVQPLLNAIDGAKNRVEIVIFRFDRGEIEKALANAAARGVFVHALIAYTNRGGEKNLRKLEMRLLDAGITVARTADDLARYHGKFLIVDRRELFLLSFNFTYLDIDHSRCFGLIASNPGLVGSPAFVVSPSNARKQLAAFQQARAAAGVEIRAIGRVTRSSSHLAAHKLSVMRLHTPGPSSVAHKPSSAARASASWNSARAARWALFFAITRSSRSSRKRFRTIGRPSSAPPGSGSRKNPPRQPKSQGKSLRQSPGTCRPSRPFSASWFGNWWPTLWRWIWTSV